MNLLAATASAAAGRVINVGTGTKITLNHLLAELGRISGHSLHPKYEAARSGDVRESLADISLMRTVAVRYSPLSRPRFDEIEVDQATKELVASAEDRPQPGSSSPALDAGVLG